MKDSAAMITRRRFLKLAGETGVALTLTGYAAKGFPRQSTECPDLPQDDPYFDLATSLTQEYQYEATVEGKIPEDLQGTLYRNGPGLFERAGYRKRCILDGDGMIQAFRIYGGTVHFQNKFVRTQKYQEEETAGRYLYKTWTTQAPGGVLANLGANIGNQAGVTVIMRNGKLYAFDESTQPYELDPETLETLGLSYLGLPEGTALYAAHWKVDSQTGEWLHFGLEYGRKVTLHITIFQKDGQLKKHRTITLPRYAYMHDFFVSDRHLIFNIHPVELSIYKFLLGIETFSGTMSWRPENGNLILVIDREGDAEPIQLTTDASWMWHALNAYEEGNEIIADFVGYQNPDHFLGEDPALFAIMCGRKVESVFPGEIRRYVINPGEKSIRQEILDEGHHEFPFVNQHLSCHKHRFGYFAKGSQGAIFFSSIVRVGMKTGASEAYDFGEGFYCGEPVFAPKPDFVYTGDDDQEPGWLLTEVYDSSTRKSFLAILQADQVSAGPIAIIHLNHHVPLSFHGYWHSA